MGFVGRLTRSRTVREWALPFTRSHNAANPEGSEMINHIPATATALQLTTLTTLQASGFVLTAYRDFGSLLVRRHNVFHCNNAATEWSTAVIDTEGKVTEYAGRPSSDVIRDEE